MKNARIIAESLSTAMTENPEWMALVASTPEEEVEVLFKSMRAPAMAASLIASSQEAAKELDPVAAMQEIEWNFESCMQILPEVYGISLHAEGTVLCLNVGSGAIAFRLRKSARDNLQNFSNT